MGLLTCSYLDINTFQVFDLFLSPQALSLSLYFVKQGRKSLNFEEPELFPSLPRLDYSSSGVSLAPCFLFLLSCFDSHPAAVESSPENECKLEIFLLIEEVCELSPHEDSACTGSCTVLLSLGEVRLPLLPEQNLLEQRHFPSRCSSPLKYLPFSFAATRPHCARSEKLA